VNAALYGVTESEPDLLFVHGPPTQLPPSLFWELAYAELVFIPVAWSDFCAADLAAAVVDFAGRRRRFGGLDDE
jgi:undecaprenyl diphosphate synthase